MPHASTQTKFARHWSATKYTMQQFRRTFILNQSLDCQQMIQSPRIQPDWVYIRLFFLGLSSTTSLLFSILNYSFFYSSCVLILFSLLYLFFNALVASPLYLVCWLCEDARVFFHLVSNHFIACATFAIFAHGAHILRFVEQIESISFGVVQIVCLAGIRVILWWKPVQYLHLHCQSKRKDVRNKIQVDEKTTQRERERWREGEKK